MNTIDCIIVNYNAGPALDAAVNSLLASSTRLNRIVIVDNASSDDSLKPIEQLALTHSSVHIVKNDQNLGFATACNIGFQQSDADFILFLNPDCVVEQKTIAVMLQALNNSPASGMAGPLIHNPDGTEQRGDRRMTPTPGRSLIKALGISRWLNGLEADAGVDLHETPLPEHTIEVEAISGACMLVKRRAIEKVGLLDEGYFMHCEDLDWYMRFRQHGFTILFVPHAIVMHAQGTCSQSRPVFVEWHKHRGMVRFYRKFYQDSYPAPLMIAVITTIWLRFAVVATTKSAKRILGRS